MPRQAYRSWWLPVVSLLVLTTMVMCLAQAEAKPGQARRFHSRGHHPHHHHRPHDLFWFYGYPYDFYWPYYYPYWPYYAYGDGPGYYAEGDHRRFPAFRMPAFFRYLGAIAKREDVAEPLRRRPSAQETAPANASASAGRLEQ
jgi:hypothetical protein